SSVGAAACLKRGLSADLSVPCQTPVVRRGRRAGRMGSSRVHPLSSRDTASRSGEALRYLHVGESRSRSIPWDYEGTIRMRGRWGSRTTGGTAAPPPSCMRLRVRLQLPPKFFFGDGTHESFLSLARRVSGARAQPQCEPLSCRWSWKSRRTRYRRR